ncbi:MAG TPA: carotenoid oxygenase family protein [Mesorhizobium sp.]|jgi:carotenoid cleavage dioxygenase|uniref:carotenoid oxygenase family protein n=1 Tax=Mesorhizobium sp. TaxID=1871066 RepID=UPI002DDCD8DD|nr:carotenoid oxygenase family protein [Mesorhizobium sp.]HEV2503644.1 carotenoid oxygenase family protein [Mesorhizobium sp.]
MDRRTLLKSGFITLTAATAPAYFLRSPMARAQQAAETKVFLSGHYEPTQVELTADRLAVQGAIPPALSGRYIRNGHNPATGHQPPYWFEGNGMLHGVRIKDGRAEWYRNRFVRTPALSGARTFRSDGSVDLTASAAATSVYAHAGRIFALQEVNLPFLVGPELQTLGVFDFGGKLKAPMTAHPKIDPRTGEMLFISYGPQEPHLTYFRVSPQGELTDVEVVPGAGPSIMHDFAITENYVIFLDPSVVFDPRSKLVFPYKWDNSYQAKIGVMARDRSKGPVKWIAVDPNFYFHISNAWEEPDGTLRLEATYYEESAWTKFSQWLTSASGHGHYIVEGDKFARWHIDPAAGKATAEIRSDISADFPTINQTFLGRRNRYTYAAAFPNGALKRNALVKYDGRTGAVTLREFPERQMPEEPWFVPADDGTEEDHGWLFSYVGDLATKRGALYILDASDIQATPTAIISIPGWIPAGVHGSWIDDKVLDS